MCRSIKTLYNFKPPATDDEVRASSLQFVRKLSGFTRPSKANEVAFTRAVDQVAHAVRELLASLVTTAPSRDRDVEASKARGRLSHLDCGRPRVLSAEERALLFVHCRDHQVGACVTCSGRFGLRDLASDLVSGHTHLCPRCRRDLTASIRAHLYGCTILPAEVRQRAFAARAAAQRLVKRSREPGDTADVLTREAEAALASLREAMRQSLPRDPR